MRRKMLLGFAWGIVASMALAAAWPLAFAGADDERPGKAPPRTANDRRPRTHRIGRRPLPKCSAWTVRSRTCN